MSTEKCWILESPMTQGAGSDVPWTITWPRSDTVGVETISVAVYKKGTAVDIVDSVMPVGSHTASENSVTLKPFRNMKSGERYIVSVTLDVDAIIDEFWFEVRAIGYAGPFILLQSGGRIILQSGGKMLSHK